MLSKPVHAAAIRSLQYVQPSGTGCEGLPIWGWKQSECVMQDRATSAQLWGSCVACIRYASGYVFHFYNFASISKYCISSGFRHHSTFGTANICRFGISTRPKCSRASNGPGTIPVTAATSEFWHVQCNANTELLEQLIQYNMNWHIILILFTYINLISTQWPKWPN